MTNLQRTLVKVISLTTLAVVLSLLIVSWALASRDSKIYPSNFSVASIPIGGLTREQAGNRLGKQGFARIGSSLQLKLPDKTVMIPVKECGIRPDYSATLQNVDRLLGRNGHIGSLINHSVIRGKCQDINMVYSFDNELLVKQLVKAQMNNNKPAVDARILYDNGLLQYITHKNGYILDIETTTQNVSSALKKGSLGPVEAGVTVLHPRVKIDDIKTVQDIIGAYALTVAHEQSVPGSNLHQAADLLDGSIIMPNEVFPAGAKLYGFVSQLNQPVAVINPLLQALKEAVLQAGLNVRQADSTLTGLSIYNPLKSPVLLSAVIKEGKLIVRVFGCQTESGKEIHLTTEEVEIPARVIEKIDHSLAPGQRRVQQEGNNGLAVRTYRIVTKNGHQVEKTLLTEEVHWGTDTIIIIGPNNQGK
ncbi:MAG: G5 domain-containing protein [Syntrophomonadaceae bacterium]|jgi:hypothetical protein